MSKVVRVAVLVGVAAVLARPGSAQVCQAASGPRAGVAAGAPAAFGNASTADTGDVTFTLAASIGESTLVARAPSVTFEKRLTKDRVSLRVRSGGDELSVDVERDGATRVGRRGKTRALKASDRPEERMRRVQELLAGSTAMLAFEGLAAYLEASDKPEAVSVVTSYALVQALRGSAAPAQALARRIKARAAAGMKRTAGLTGGEESVIVCWAEYAYALLTFATEYEGCVNDWWWNPIAQAGCAFVYLLQGDLAFFNALACAGGLPI